LRDESFATNLATNAKKETYYDNVLFKKQFFADGDIKSYERKYQLQKTSYWLRFADWSKRSIVLSLEKQYNWSAYSDFKIDCWMV
jgi:hypothetical protein